MLCKRYYIIFSTFSLKFKCKICIRKEVIHNFKKSYFGHVTSHELIDFKKMVRVWKTKSLLFCLTYDPLIVFRRKNHITFIFIKTMSHDLLVQMAYWKHLGGKWDALWEMWKRHITDESHERRGCYPLGGLGHITSENFEIWMLWNAILDCSERAIFF